jgi:hypothetical protein
MSQAVDPRANDRIAATLRGRTFIGVAIVVLILLSGNLLGAVLVFVWAAFSKTPLEGRR